MDVIHRRVAGLDVHKRTVVACARVMRGRTVVRECETFATTTDGLVALLQWLNAHRCTHVALEATGVYWMPVFKILSEGAFDLIVANAAHLTAVPGRKTDLNDARWIADLMACGLVKASFVPEEELQELRALMRTRKQFSYEQTRYVQRLQKTLAEANLRLDAVLSDLMGASGRRILEAIIAGVQAPQELAALARGLKASPQELRDALHGRVTAHHRFLLELYLGQWDRLDAAIRELDRAVEDRLTQIDAQAPSEAAPFRTLIALLCTIPGVGPLSATVILSEIGRAMSRFPTAGHLVSWAGLCPGSHESAGKAKPMRLRKGNPHLKTRLIQCAWAATRQKDSYYRAQFFRLRARRGPQKAICAVAASLLTGIYHMLATGAPHHDLGADHFDRRSRESKTRQLVAQLSRLGYQVHLEPAATAA
jgi:transposase